MYSLSLEIPIKNVIPKNWAGNEQGEVLGAEIALHAPFWAKLCFVLVTAEASGEFVKTLCAGANKERTKTISAGIKRAYGNRCIKITKWQQNCQKTSA